MREKFEDIPEGFPTIKQLEIETFNAIKSYGGTATTLEIKDYITKELSLSEDVLEYENSDGINTLIDYRMRWVRTSLKNKGLIENVSRGVWKTL